MKRFLAWVLILAALLSVVPPVAAAEAVEPLEINVNFMGCVSPVRVLRNANGELLAPISWITYFGVGMKCEKTGDVHTYYRADQEKEGKFARRLFISLEKHRFVQGVYFSESAITPQTRVQGNYYPICEGKFSRWVEWDGDYWVPMAEILALTDVEAEVSEDDGSLCISPVLITAFDALYKHHSELKDLLFDADEVVGSGIMTVGGWVISTGMDLRIDRADLIFNSGRINDYEDIFKDYLVDNEAYLEAFDAESNPILDAVREWVQDSDQVEIFYGLASTLFDSNEKLPDGSLRSLFRAFSPDVYGTVADGFGAMSDTVDMAMSLYEYGNVYFNQVEDHRKMLGAVYYYDKELKGKPSYTAATNIQKIYNTDADNSEAVVQEGVRDLLNKILTDELEEQFLNKMPAWYLAVELTKLFAADSYEYVANSGLMGLVDNTVEYSYKIYKKRVKAGDFRVDSLDKLRLCALMPLVASRYAFDTYWEGKLTKVTDPIDEILHDLYLAGRWRDYGAADSYAKLLKKYRSSLDGLKVSRISAANTAEIMLMAEAIRAQEWLDGLRWGGEDLDGDGLDELVFCYYTTDSGYQTLVAEMSTSGGSMSTQVYLTEDLDLDYRFRCQDLSKQYLLGSMDAIRGDLDAYARGRDGFMFADTADIDGDGDQDWVYAFYNVGRMWQSYADDLYMNLNDPIISLLVLEQMEEGVRLRVNRLVGQPLFVEENSGYAQSLQAIPYSMEDHRLNIEGYLYTYDLQEGYVFDGFYFPDSNYTVEALLQGDVDILHEGGLELNYPDPDDPYWVTLTLGGEAVEVVFDETDGRIAQLKVSCDGGSLTVAGDATTSQRRAEFQAKLPNTIWMEGDIPQYGPNRSIIWPEPYPVRGDDGDITWYETYFYWMDSNQERIYRVLLALDSDGPDGRVCWIRFDYEPEPSWNLIHHLAGID